MSQTLSAPTGADAHPTPSAQLALIQWHLGRYDTLRSSSANRAAVVLSADAILLGGQAVIVSQIIGTQNHEHVALPMLVVATVALSVLPVVLSLMWASGVLLTRRQSRIMFAKGEQLPASPVFNGRDTAEIKSFDEFTSTMSQASYADLVRAAQVELWIVIHQHRYRYERLRKAVIALRWAALVVLLELAAAVAIVALLEFYPDSLSWMRPGAQ